MSVYTTDPATICYVIVRRFGDLRFLSPAGNWIIKPMDAGLFTEESARLHCKQNPARSFLHLDKAQKQYRLSINKLSLERKIQTC